MSWKRALLKVDGGSADDGPSVFNLLKDLRTHWGFYLASSVFTAVVCTFAVKLMVG